MNKPVHGNGAVSLASEFLGIKSPNPFWLASAPPTDKAYNVNRAFEAGSPPPRAAMTISLISRVKIFPRLASSAAFLCLIVCHFE